MTFRFLNSGNGKALERFVLKDQMDVFFALTCLMLRNSRSEIVIPSSVNDIKIILNQIPCLSVISATCQINPEKMTANEKLIIQADACPEAVIPLSILFASCGIEADITGLESLNNPSNAGYITALQRILYRFNILTDYCGGSKFKVYNTRTLTGCPQTLRSDFSSFPLWMFIPFAIRTGEITFEADKAIMDTKIKMIEAGGFDWKKI